MTEDTKPLQTFAEAVIGGFPEFQQVLDQAKAGDLSEEDALRCMNEILQSNPEVMARFQAEIRKLYKTVADELQAQDPGLRAKLLGEDPQGAVFVKPRGQAQLNPLVEAALIERAQFDEDIPEMRTGAKPHGVLPAVSVDTTVRDPAALGMMLGEAAQQVAGKIAAAEPARQKLLVDLANAPDETALALVQQSAGGLPVLSADEARDLVFDGRLPALDIPEYPRGRVPAPVTVQQPSGSALLAMTPQERKQGAWRFLSTTQGRRTALAGLTELVEVKLRGEGFEVDVRSFEPGATEAVLAAHEWTVGIDGPGATQPAFSLIDIAAASIAKGLTKKMGDHRGKVILEMTTINTVDIRSVGWAGRLLSKDRLLGSSP